jgi:hypothetical protein
MYVCRSSPPPLSHVEIQDPDHNTNTASSCKALLFPHSNVLFRHALADSTVPSHQKSTLPWTFERSVIMAAWKVQAAQKRDSVNALIPAPWRLPCPVPSAAEQRDVTGEYIQQFLSPREILITETDAVGIVEKTTAGAWKARDVAQAFCHRAALAHQMVISC